MESSFAARVVDGTQRSVLVVPIAGGHRSTGEIVRSV
jgi:hypothetical protein